MVQGSHYERLDKLHKVNQGSGPGHAVILHLIQLCLGWVAFVDKELLLCLALIPSNKQAALGLNVTATAAVAWLKQMLTTLGATHLVIAPHTWCHTPGARTTHLVHATPKC